ncbi:MAG: hypothetical protein AAF791_02855 [Bacteroidota bacterium]
MTPITPIVRAEASQAMLVWMLGVQADAVERIDSGPGPMTDRGLIRRSLGVEGPTIRGDVIEGEVQATAAHALYAHEGRRPGKPPPTRPLREWAERKLGASADEARSVGFLVARAIGRRGTNGNPFLREPFEAALPRLFSSLADAVARGVAKSFPPQTI